jgi:hypothetical protein
MIEYRVRTVPRFIVTKFENYEGGGCSCGAVGTYDSFDVAYEVGCALAKAEQERLGLLPGDLGVIFPDTTPVPLSADSVK